MKTHCLLATVGILSAFCAEALCQDARPTVGEAYPGLISGALASARVADLPDGLIFRAKEVGFTEKDVMDKIAKAPKEVQGQLKKNALFMLEQIATPELIVLAARQEAARAGKPLTEKNDEVIVNNYVQAVAGKVIVPDKDAAAFYAENKDIFGGAEFEKVQSQVQQYLLAQRQQEAVFAHVRMLGQTFPIEVSAPWVKAQAQAAMDNPVDKARQSGLPSLVDFGSKGCRPCDMLEPILATLRKKYDGKANVLFVSVAEEKVLAARFRIESIPVQVFFDRNGVETFRHVGFWPQDELEKKLAAIGVR